MTVELHHLSHDISKNGLETAEQQILTHLTSHYDEHIVEKFKEFFTGVKRSMSLGLKSRHGLFFENLSPKIKVDLSKGTLLFEDQSARKKG